jgi:hypothetical protein
VKIKQAKVFSFLLGELGILYWKIYRDQYVEMEFLGSLFRISNSLHNHGKLRENAKPTLKLHYT